MSANKHQPKAVIGYHLSTVQRVDCIVVSDGGRIGEQDSLQQWAHQSGGFIDE